MLDNYDFLIFDFDETIAKIEINWQPWCSRVLALFREYEPNFELQSDCEVENWQNYFLTKYAHTDLRLKWQNFCDQFEFNATGLKPNEKVVELIKKSPQKKYLWSNNGFDFLKLQLEKLDIGNKFEKIITRDQMELIKPNALAFEAIIWDKVSPLNNYVMIGNDWDNDFRAAKGAGIDYLDVGEFTG